MNAQEQFCRLANATSTKPAPGLAAGQLWKVEDGYLQIVELGHRLIHYKLIRQPDQTAAMTRMIGIDALAVYLRTLGASLVSCGASGS